MDIAYLGLLVGNIFLIVYYRLMIHYHGEGAADPARARAGLAVVASMPARRGLQGVQLRYWRRYWLAVAAMCVLIAAGLAWRYPHIVAGLRAAG